MGYKKNPLDHNALRQLALARLSKRPEVKAVSLVDEAQIQHLIEELEIHHIELELQNDHLTEARSQLEKALYQSNDLYDFSPVGNVLIDARGKITKLNLAGAQLLATERARLMGNRLNLYVAPAQRSLLNAMLERAKNDHMAQSAELVLELEDQASRYVQAKVVWIDVSQGWQIALIDVTEQRGIEAQLSASEQRLGLAMAAVGDGVWDWQVASGEVEVSDGFASLLGFTKPEMGPYITDITRLIHPDERSKVMQCLQDCISSKEDRFYSEHRLQCKDGSWKWVLVRGAAVLRTQDKQATRIIGTLVDDSQKKQAEAALAASAEFQRAVFDSMSAHMAVLDQAGMIVQTNVAWHTYASSLGCEDSVGKSYLSVLSEITTNNPQTAQMVATGMAAIAGGDIPYYYLAEPALGCCGNYWFTIKLTPVREAAHRMVVTHEDVSELKRAELASLALANVDALTGAQSRQHFMSLAEQELARSLRYELDLVVLMLDLDHFKQINDSFGHQAGDAVLKGFVRTVKGVLRESDFIGRIGGEEFAVLLPNTTQDGGLALANRIIVEVRLNPQAFNEKSIHYTVSVGAGFLSNQATLTDLLAECDVALYRAKNGGRDRLEASWNPAANTLG